MVQAVGRRPLTVEARIGTLDQVGLVVDNVALGEVSLRVHRLFPGCIIPPWLYILLYHLRNEQ
jgi:hypothetical protein